jgi:hypothetical protein
LDQQWKRIETRGLSDQTVAAIIATLNVEVLPVEKYGIIKKINIKKVSITTLKSSLPPDSHRD